MDNANIVEAKIEQAFYAKSWYGLISIEEAVEDATAYRRSLGSKDRQLYDEQIELGRYPTSAMETVEIISGRQQPQGNEVASAERLGNVIGFSKGRA